MATSFARSDASSHAVALVKAALENGAIKLNGPMGLDGPAHYAAQDAQYLATLINDLAEKIKSPNYD
ncbi:hypothetical protein [Burkholderia pseudomultivorans]|uniref:hypothetical protein n=1 Tax=Burkholderia pseudomultivorans TaxID=1207504 RepID=UPI000A523D7A|nr:hypothetical protein [Burkholderia pseudomultivorans]